MVLRKGSKSHKLITFHFITGGNFYKILGFYFILFLFLGGGIGLYLFNKKTTNVESMDASVTISAKTFSEEFTANADSATKSHQNQVIEIEGKVTAVETLKDNTCKIEMLEGDVILDFAFRLEDSQYAAKTKSGKKIKIKGKFVGYDDLVDKIITFNDCYIVE
jgi:hypothetical protein